MIRVGPSGAYPEFSGSQGNALDVMVLNLPKPQAIRVERRESRIRMDLEKRNDKPTVM